MLQTMPSEVFVRLYEVPRIPVVISGLQEDWKAKQFWNPADLDQRFANHKFKVCHRLDYNTHPAHRDRKNAKGNVSEMTACVTLKARRTVNGSWKLSSPCTS